MRVADEKTPCGRASSSIEEVVGAGPPLSCWSSHSRARSKITFFKPKAPGISAEAWTPWLSIRWVRMPAPCSAWRYCIAASGMNSRSSKLLEMKMGTSRCASVCRKASGERWSAHATTAEMLVAVSQSRQIESSSGGILPSRLPLLMSSSAHTRLGAASKKKAVVRFPQPDMETAAESRASCAAPSTASPAPYEMPAAAKRRTSTCHSAARRVRRSSSALTSAMSSAPPRETTPPAENQPRASYSRTTYPADAQACCAPAYSMSGQSHELAISTAGKVREEEASTRGRATRTGSLTPSKLTKSTESISTG
mmetsp:Transcript_35515/g.86307  ORF Transcript_35515/g.86307 Transcript_35515/m.86307 type:complete len:310 (+) Transcript_35515:902-1831(+)